MFLWIGGSRKAFEQTVEKLYADAMVKVQEDLEGIKNVTDLSAKVRDLRQQVETLEISAAQKKEDFDRREREIEHKVGLERKRAEFEKEKAISEATIKVQRENLDADKTRFANEMKFQNDRFTKEVDYLKDILTRIMERLPDASIKIKQER